MQFYCVFDWKSQLNCTSIMVFSKTKQKSQCKKKGKEMWEEWGKGLRKCAERYFFYSHYTDSGNSKNGTGNIVGISTPLQYPSFHARLFNRYGSTETSKQIRYSKCQYFKRNVSGC